MLPPSLQDSLPAGWLAFAGRASTLWIAAKVSGHPSSFSGLGLAQGKFHFEPPFTSFDHLVGAGEQRGRHLKAECLSSLEVDNKLQRCWLNDWQVSRFDALEDLPGVHAHLTIQIGQAGAIAHQAAGYGIAASFVDRRYLA